MSYDILLDDILQEYDCLDTICANESCLRILYLFAQVSINFKAESSHFFDVF